MKKFALSSAALAGILSLFSCKKDNSANTSSTRPKTYTENVTSSISGNSIITADLTWDNKSRLVSVVTRPEPPAFKFLYNYGANSFTFDEYNSNVLTIHEMVWLNAIPYIDSTFQFNDTHDSSTEKYIYNAEKQLVQKNEYNYSATSGATLYNTTNYSYDSNGNLVTETDYFTTTTYDYYSNLLTPFSTDMAYLPLTRNLPKTFTTNQGGISVSATHTYGFDSKNRLVADSVVATNGDVIIKSYTY
jgi:hypothetical protein